MKRPNAPLSPGDPTPGEPLSKATRKPTRPKTQTTQKPASTPSADRATVQSKAQQLAQKLADERRHAAWLNGFRFSTFSLIMAGVLILGVLSLIPRVQELVAQRQQIDALNADIAATRSDIAAKEAERQRWNDPTFIETQARERLYFVQPGDVSYLVINDLGPGALTAQASAAATTGVQQTESEWLGTLIGSVWSAGNAPVSTSSTSVTTGAAQ